MRSLILAFEFSCEGVGSKFFCALSLCGMMVWGGRGEFFPSWLHWSDAGFRLSFVSSAPSTVSRIVLLQLLFPFVFKSSTLRFQNKVLQIGRHDGDRLSSPFPCANWRLQKSSVSPCLSHLLLCPTSTLHRHASTHQASELYYLP